MNANTRRTRSTRGITKIINIKIQAYLYSSMNQQLAEPAVWLAEQQIILTQSAIRQHSSDPFI